MFSRQLDIGVWSSKGRFELKIQMWEHKDI